MGQELIVLPSSRCPSGCRTRLVRSGSFTRSSDGVRVQRFLCKDCGSRPSEAAGDLCYRQKKRQFNKEVCYDLVSGVSQRRSALLLRINRKTVVRKLKFLGRGAVSLLAERTQAGPVVTEFHFDDLETFVHTKCKPLSVTMAVEAKSRRILGFRVSDMPAKGKLSKIALAKYGPRADQRAEARQSLFAELKPVVREDAVISSDKNPHYGPDVRRHFPKATHKTTKGRRGCVVGQGELKRGGYDPLFSLNHSFAMLRANINRLFRRTWCTTKLKERLVYHIALYALFHNMVLIEKGRK